MRKPDAQQLVVDAGGRIERLSEYVRVKVTPSMLSELQRIADREDRSVAAVVRRAVRFYLDQRRKGLV